MPEASTLVSAVPGEFSAGDVIGGKYRLERPLGEGGQAWVWQARNEVLDVRVALKFLRSDNADEIQKRRLLQEARSAAQLGHAAIVRVFDYGQTDVGDPYLVMELLDGMSLGDRLVQEQRLSAIEAARLLLPIADALVAAHALGLVHRDLKPDNVFLALSGEAVQPKLLDFGVVKLQPAPGRAGHLTETGAVVGSPAYLSPEQARGRDDIDQRADVWSFSAMLYECVTGDLPFHGTNYNALLRSIVEDPPRSTEELGVSDAAFWAIVERGLAKSRDDRWPSMLALGHALAGWLVSRGTPDDVCGVSLDFKWLRAQPAARAVGLPSPLLRAPEGDRDKELVQSSERRRSVWPRRVRYGLVGAGVLLIVLAAALLRLARSSREAPRAETAPELSASDASTASLASPSPSVVPVERAAPLPVEDARPLASSAPRASASVSAPVVKTARAPRPLPRPVPSAPPAPGHDLLNPY